MCQSSMAKPILILAVLTISLVANVSFAATTSSSSQKKSLLSADDLVFFNKDGRAEIVNREKYMAQMRKTPIATQEQHYNNETESEDDIMKSSIRKPCTEYNVFTMKRAEEFVDWDVIMSGVVLAPPNRTASISISESYRISNKINVPAGIRGKIIEKFLTKALKIGFDNVWTTTKNTGFTFTIPPGKYGAVVSNPLTTRHSGYLDSGCIGSSERTEFSSDSYSSKNFEGLSWVEGVIGLCVGKTFPLPRCIGEGFLRG
ncbi:putative celp0028 effector like protein [Golovinomyces cichoracearum]|uniref:Putative celp0028 effector like protein n=1 Tax=Golovinomyces cichoracearum TaxID=62708 RepID=A0A420IAD9_9PEZI|nr:putative celp0028 effector like protein [Golovinomyces cichoracearum]